LKILIRIQTHRDHVKLFGGEDVIHQIKILSWEWYKSNSNVQSSMFIKWLFNHWLCIYAWVNM